MIFGVRPFADKPFSWVPTEEAPVETPIWGGRTEPGWRRQRRQREQLVLIMQALMPYIAAGERKPTRIKV